MVDEISTAKVTINVNRNEGTQTKSGSKNYLKEMASSLKDMKSNAEKASKLNLSGFLGAGGAGGAAVGASSAAALVSVLLAMGVSSAIIATILSLVGGRVGGYEAVDESGEETGVHVAGYYQEALVDGERRILEVNEQTGEVVRILTEREAIEKGILDENGKIYENMRAYRGEWDNVRDQFTQHGKILKITGDELNSILSEEAKTLELKKEENRLQKIINERKARLAHTASVVDLNDTYTRYTFSGSPYSSDEPMDFNDILWNNYYQEQQQSQSQQQCSFVEDIWPGVLQ